MLDNIMQLAGGVAIVCGAVWLLAFILTLSAALKRTSATDSEEETNEMVNELLVTDYGAALYSITRVSKFFLILALLTWLGIALFS